MFEIGFYRTLSIKKGSTFQKKKSHVKFCKKNENFELPPKMDSRHARVREASSSERRSEHLEIYCGSSQSFCHF